MICIICKEDSEETFPGVEEPPTWGMGLLENAEAYYGCPGCLPVLIAPFRFDHKPIPSTAPPDGRKT